MKTNPSRLQQASRLVCRILIINLIFCSCTKDQVNPSTKPSSMVYNNKNYYLYKTIDENPDKSVQSAIDDIKANGYTTIPPNEIRAITGLYFNELKTKVNYVTCLEQNEDGSYTTIAFIKGKPDYYITGNDGAKDVSTRIGYYTIVLSK